MANTTTKFFTVGVAHATFDTFITNLNTALASYDGFGIPGNANQFKSIQGVDTYWDGTNHCAIIKIAQNNATAS